MDTLAMALLLQASLIGPPDTPPGAKLPKPEAARDCGESKGDEIVVCGQGPRGTIVTNQSTAPVTPPRPNPYSRSDNGLMQFRVSKDAVLDGGGPKGSAGVGIRIRF